MKMSMLLLADALNRIVKEPMKGFKKWQIELFGVKELEKRLEGMLENVSITLYPEEKTIILEGFPSEISQAKIMIIEEISKFHTKIKEVSPLLAKMASSKTVMGAIKQSIGQFAVVEIQSDQIQVHATTAEDAVNALAVVEKMMYEENIIVDTDTLQALQTERLKTFCTKHETASNGKVKITFIEDKQIISFCCTSDRKDDTSRAIKEFLKKDRPAPNPPAAVPEMDFRKLQQQLQLQLNAEVPRRQVCVILQMHFLFFFCVRNPGS